MFLLDLSSCPRVIDLFKFVYSILINEFYDDDNNDEKFYTLYDLYVRGHL